MAYYRLCPSCGNRTVSESESNVPKRCRDCGQDLFGCLILNEEDTEDDNIKEGRHATESIESDYYFCLVTLDNQNEIIIPKPGGVVGRAALGSEILLKNTAISREHITVTYKNPAIILIEDKSSFGTFVNGTQLVKGQPKAVRNGDIIRLYDFDLMVKRNEERQ